MFSDAKRSIEGTVALRPKRELASAFDARYNFHSIANFIVTGRRQDGSHFRKVAVQFSDELLFESVRVLVHIKESVAQLQSTADTLAQRPISIFALADSSFSPCCPDEVAARHYDADAIVHLGYACFSQTNSLPVLHDMPTADADATTGLAEAVDAQLATADQVVVVVHPGIRGTASALAAHLTRRSAAEVTESISASGSYARISMSSCADSDGGAAVATKCVMVADAVAYPPSDQTRATLLDEVPSEWCVNGATFPVNPQQRIIFYGPPRAPQLHQLALVALYNESNGGADASSGLVVVAPTRSDGTAAEVADAGVADEASYDDVSVGVRVVRQRIRQRMFNIEQVKAATSVGIVVTNTGMRDTKVTAEMLRTACIRAGRRAYILFLGHLNPAKLANFADSIDCFVVVACPNSRIAHFANKSDGIMKPLVSPAEALIALGHSDFMSIRGFSTNFELALGAEASVNKPVSSEGAEDGDDDKDRRRADQAESQALVTGRAMNVAVAGQSSLQRLHERSYIGLDPRIGQTPVQASLAEGRAGIARGYTTEAEAQRAAPAEASSQPSRVNNAE